MKSKTRGKCLPVDAIFSMLRSSDVEPAGLEEIEDPEAGAEIYLLALCRSKTESIKGILQALNDLCEGRKIPRERLCCITALHLFYLSDDPKLKVDNASSPNRDLSPQIGDQMILVPKTSNPLIYEHLTPRHPPRGLKLLQLSAGLEHYNKRVYHPRGPHKSKRCMGSMLKYREQSTKEFFDMTTSLCKTPIIDTDSPPTSRLQ